MKNSIIFICLIGLILIDGSLCTKHQKRDFSSDINEFVSQMTQKMTDIVKINTKLTLQNSLASINATQDQLMNDIKDIDQNKYTKHAVLQFRGKTVVYDGSQFTDGFLGKALNETETKQAFQVLRESIVKSLENVQKTGQSLTDNLNKL
ncbi:unnamed protein product [Brachionus calyciflorus]|uniref:Uncharacterized protein n=1 Tax=Brachionus calyciflorus TaxID=104777 RepID=A0A813M2J1_9BILA|nr:unnamed protein product [Brachionus calyciflorus]